MSEFKKSRSCANFRSVEKGLTPAFRNPQVTNCKDCVYFSSRNCGMDAADSIAPDLEATLL